MEIPIDINSQNTTNQLEIYLKMENNISVLPCPPLNSLRIKYGFEEHTLQRYDLIY